MRTITLIALCSMQLSFYSYSQQKGIKKGFLLQDSLIVAQGLEKIFTHFDRYYYQPNDTLRLSGYVINSVNGTLYDSSKIIYLDVVNADNKIVSRISTNNFSGKFNANIFLRDRLFLPGKYYIAAYTKHLLNYDVPVPKLFSFIVSKDDPTSNFKLDISNYAYTGAGITLMGKISAPKKLLNNKLIAIRMYSEKTDTVSFVPDLNGNFTVDLPFDKNTSTLNIEIKHEEKIEPPLKFTLKNMQVLTMDFYPEGGTLLHNTHQKIGIKVSGIINKGMPVKGIIIDQNNKPVAFFQTNQNGLGSVYITFKKGETYRAMVNSKLKYDLPPVKESGTTLAVLQEKIKDSIEIVVKSTPDLYNSRYFLRASAQGVSIAMGSVYLQEKDFSMRMARNILPKGICNFSLFNEKEVLVNERNIFINRQDIFDIECSQKNNQSTDSMRFFIVSKPRILQQTPALSKISLSIVNAKTLLTNTGGSNLISYYYLQSELDNAAENYVAYERLDSSEHLDNILLTQKYIRPHFKRSVSPYPHEQEFMIAGKVRDIVNKPLEKVQLMLLVSEGKKFIFFQQAESAKDGTFRFQGFPAFNTDSVNFVFSAKKKNGTFFSPTIVIDEKDIPIYNAPPTTLNTWFLNYKKVAPNLSGLAPGIQPSNEQQKGFLEEVIVKGKSKIAGSKNLNQNGGADIVITESRLKEFPQETSLQVLYKTIPEFNRGPIGKYLYGYKIKNAYVVFTIDGYNINKYYDPVSESRFAFADYCDTYLKYLRAEDIKGIEVMTSNKYTLEYEKYYQYNTTIDISYVFVEITTFSGNGAFYKHSSNSFQYKPLVPVSYNSEHSPSSHEIALSNYRNINGLKTVFWNADLSIPAGTEAGFAFIKPGEENDWIIIICGIDQLGRIGYYHAYLDEVVFKIE
ncbi:MAG: hypothetical protein H7Y86_06630 [Rhizobacter sp.]|nr:hypothetical protein [Ferruginibacter sp.]